VLSPFDDQWNPPGNYPNLPPYPVGQEREVTVLQTGQTPYVWSSATTNFVKPEKDNLVVYEVLVRDFDTAQLKVHAERLYTIAQEVITNNADFSKATVTMEVKEQYRNMREIIDQHPLIVEKALEAYGLVGLTPIVTPIRGGTDGSRMSFLGLPTPNICTGMQAIHSKHEWIGVSDMEKAVEVLVKLVEII
jgi:di/tripeptidase